MVMPQETFDELGKLLDSEAPARSVDFLIEWFRGAKKYPHCFEARMMRARLELGLPLIQMESAPELPAEARAAYEQALLQAARETGELFLADGNIPGAWPYLRATGDSARVADAIERVGIGEDADAVIQIALQEGVNPARGLELVFQKYGICRALTAFGMYGGKKDRERSLHFLARSLYDELKERIALAIEQEEGAAPEATNILALMAGRDWLFGEYSAYVDTSHLVSLLQYAPEVTGSRTLELFHEFCEYGKRLSPNFRVAGNPPFEDFYIDTDHYVLASAGADAECHLDHFRRKLREANPGAVGQVHAQALVTLLLKRGCNEEALQVALEHFPAARSSELSCPTAIQICQLAGRFDLLMRLAREQGDELNYVAAGLELGRKAKVAKLP
jgi:hypothetical protein